MIGLLPVERLFVRTSTGVDELARLMRGADEEIVGEVFKFTEPTAIEAIVGRADDVRATFLMDPEVYARKWFAETRRLFEDTGVAIHPHGSMPQKVHAKGFVFDRQRAWLSTAPVMDLGRKLDFTATFSGDAARALRDATLASVSGGRGSMRRAADTAARHGILFNDRHAGITHLRDGVKHVIDSAETELVIATKSITDRKLAARIVRRAQEGVDVYIATQSEMMSRGVRRIFDEAGVTFVDDVDMAMHGNAAVADGRLGYFGSGHFTGRGMVRDSGYRSSRELGALVGGEHAARIRDEILAFTAEMPRSSA